MSLNPSKCTLLPISRRQQHLFSHNHKHLIQSDLNLKCHVNSVCSKVSQLLGFIKRTSGHTKVSLQLYQARCRPIWNQPTKCIVNRIEKIQHDFTRYFFKQSVINHDSADYLGYSQRLDSLNLASLESRRKLLSLCFCYQIFYNHPDVDNSLFQINHCRDFPKFRIPFSRCNTLKYPLSASSVELSSHWNSLFNSQQFSSWTPS